MIDTTLKTIISFVVTGFLGYVLNQLRNYKKIKSEILQEFKELKESQLCDMRSDLSSKFYIYDAMDEVEDYLFLSWQEKAQRYFNLGGNAYIHQLYEKSNKWRIKQTGYLK